RPQEAYPYIAGERDETGSGKGAGCNVNLPLPAGTDWPRYRPALETALEKVAAFAPDSVVVSLGFDTVAGDPMGSFRLRVEEFEEMGRLIAGLGMPLLVVQEGGYLVSALGQCALNFFAGLAAPGGKPCP
ncbi:MAG: histone deacetylase family protein, partial [SAR324 cluster bacterium]|nr:histone deacetylase family protein [SAR324 cluster bacterium]